ncbi:hypothetical protein XELAEV_18037650mg [Xenopus laevis]|uniref:Helix-turn-helix domain-containing protein n=1 Tax=Xenopus laevis TaxID=8355 RepID=A0A974CDR4_XENLA|nr:hypothetical protein XELAEV_18037650mg [Xenopus laevis]
MLWLRYIDDVLLIWLGTQKDFFDFINILNNNDINLKVTAEIQRESINFLDIRVYRGINHNIHTTVYRKETATNSLLHANSLHPQSTIRGIPTGQYLRVRRLCNTITDFKVEAKKLYDRFKARGYSHNSLKRAYKKALASDRNALLVPKKLTSIINNEEKNNNQVRIIGDYSTEHDAITRIITKHWHILEQDDVLKQYVGERPTITFRRSRNLRDHLVHSHLTTTTKSSWLAQRTIGCYKCGNCLACPYIEKTLSVKGRMDIEEYKLSHFMNCKTTSVVYIMRCPCPKLYVGKTCREFRRRILEHIGDVRNKRNTSVAVHINEKHGGKANTMKFFAVEHFQHTTRIGDIDKKLLQCEAKWIYWLNSRAPMV